MVFLPGKFWFEIAEKGFQIDDSLIALSANKINASKASANQRLIYKQQFEKRPECIQSLTMIENLRTEQIMILYSWKYLIWIFALIS